MKDWFYRWGICVPCSFRRKTTCRPRWVTSARELDQAKLVIKRLHADARVVGGSLIGWQQRTLNAEAAIARVRELCDVAHTDCQEEFIPAMDGYVLFLKVDDVLRALDGPE